MSLRQGSQIKRMVTLGDADLTASDVSSLLLSSAPPWANDRVLFFFLEFMRLDFLPSLSGPSSKLPSKTTLEPKLPRTKDASSPTLFFPTNSLDQQQVKSKDGALTVVLLPPGASLLVLSSEAEELVVPSEPWNLFFQCISAVLILMPVVDSSMEEQASQRTATG